MRGTAMSTSSTLVLLYCISTAVAIAVRRLRVPFTVALVIVGLVLGSLHLVAPPHLTRELLFTFFLPGLLFEAAFHLDLPAFRAWWRSALGLAVPGVLVAMGLTAVMVAAAGRALGLSPALDLTLGFVFGALVAATDPVAVTAIFRETRAPARLGALVEAESLFNDGTGVVFLSLVLAYALGTVTSPVVIALEFALVAGGGVLVGLVVGWVISMVIRRVDEPAIEIGLTVIAAYGSFVLAEQLGASGVLATVVAGMMCGRHGRDLGMSDASRAAVATFWEYVAFALNSIVFLLLGFSFDAARLGAIWPLIIVAFVAMTVARAAIVFATLGVQRVRSEGMPWSWGTVITLGGLRGALSVVLALALPAELPQRELVVSLTIGVVLLSIVVQGLTVPLVIRRLALESDTPRDRAP
ncbi:MAG TPA: sodium:proton antiporter [Gemmatimonadaceae bacterium]|nr:sodium:proton antiporter [Gemmatimonadaceae bacterium]